MTEQGSSGGPRRLQDQQAAGSDGRCTALQPFRLHGPTHRHVWKEEERGARVFKQVRAVSRLRTLFSKRVSSHVARAHVKCSLKRRVPLAHTRVRIEALY